MSLRKLTCRPERSIVSVPDSWLHLSSSIQMVGKILDGEVEVSTSNYVIYLTVLERFLRVGRDMVAAQNSLRVRTDPFDVRDGLPVALYHRGLGLYRN